MKEYIFTWNIANISYSWHKKGEKIESPSFVADTLQNTLWTLRLYPRGKYFDDWLSLYLYRGKDKGPEILLFECELSCVSANNLTLASHTHLFIDKSIVESKFLKIHEVFVQRKALYLQQDILRLRCRIWTPEGDVDEVGQSFGCTRLKIERILSVEDMNPRITKKKTVFIHTNRRNKLLMSVNIFHEEDGLKIEIRPINTRQIKFSTFKFSAVGRSRKPCKYVNSWLEKPCQEVGKVPFTKTAKTASVRNKLKLTCEFIYTLGEDTKSIEKVGPCSFKFPEFPSNCVLSCIPSGKLPDCPSMSKDLWDLYAKQILCDMQLKTQTTSFSIHKVVLCARSPVFLAMFKDDRTIKCVEVEDLEDSTLDKFIIFLYTDRFEATQWDAVLELYCIADKYEVERLRFLCSSYLMDKIDNLKVYELLMLADKHGDYVLKSKVEDYIIQSRTVIFGSSMWEQFSDVEPLLAAKTMLCEYDEERENGKPREKYKLSSYPNVMDDFRSLYQSQKVSDIAIHTTGDTFPSHKIMLYAGSPTIRRRLIVRRKLIDSLKMEDLEDDTASRLLLFLYTDSLGDINWEAVTKLYHAAVAYEIERLKIKCSCFFIKNLRVSNASNLLQMAHEHRDARLKSLVQDFISLNNLEITTSEDWAKLGETDLPEYRETRQSKRLRLESNG